MKPSEQIQISIEGTKDFGKHLDGLKRIVKQYAEEIVAEEAKFAVSEARKLYKNAEYDGVNDVKVERRKTKDGYHVYVRGNALWFIEYGTGVYWNNKKHGTAAYERFGHRNAGFTPFRHYKDKGLLTKRVTTRERKPLGYYKHNATGEERDDSLLSRGSGMAKGWNHSYWFYTAKPGDKVVLGQIARDRNPNGTSRITRGNPAQHIIDQVVDATEKQIPIIAKNVKLRDKK